MDGTLLKQIIRRSIFKGSNLNFHIHGMIVLYKFQCLIFNQTFYYCMINEEEQIRSHYPKIRQTGVWYLLKKKGKRNNNVNRYI